MGEADGALREEIEKVRERARLQALAQGLGPDAAAALGNNAVEEFCSRWGIRPEMVAPGVLRGPRAGSTTGQPFREDARKVDLGASPMRNAANPGQTQAIRIADLLKRAKDSEGMPRVQAPPPAAAPSHPASTTRSGATLSSLLSRMRTPESVAPTPPAPAAAPAPAPAPAAPPRSVTMSETLGGGGTLTGNAERRRQVLEEFDRTYAEVQAMLEQRIGVVDIALNDASKGISGVMMKAAQGGLRQDEMEVLALDVERLREHLHTMTSLCDEFLQHMNQIAMARPGGGKPK